MAIAWPMVLAPLNRAWFRFGLLLHKVMSPLVMGILFFVVIMPIGLFMRLGGKDIINQKLDRQKATYWVDRDPLGPAPETMKKQF